MLTAQTKITKCVEDYIALQPDEYERFKLQIASARGGLADETFGTAAHSSLRALFEMPEVLHEMIVNQLTVEELTWFKEGGSNRKEGADWFARTFPVFRIPDKV